MRFLLSILSLFVGKGEQVSKAELLKRIGDVPDSIKRAVREIVFLDARKDESGVFIIE